MGSIQNKKELYMQHFAFSVRNLQNKRLKKNSHILIIDFNVKKKTNKTKTLTSHDSRLNIC